MIKAFIFDLDGVLVSTDDYHYRSWMRIAEEEGFDFFDYEFNHKFRGVGRMECIDIITRASGKQYTDEQKKELAERKNRYFVESLESLTPDALFPGVLDLLNELRKRNIRTAVASNSKNAMTIIEKVGIKSLLDTIVDGYQITNSKPDPEVFLLAARKLNVDPSECLVFEDAVAGIEAAKRAGMKAIGIGTQTRLPNAEIVIPNIAHLNLDSILKAYN